MRTSPPPRRQRGDRIGEGGAKDASRPFPWSGGGRRPLAMSDLIFVALVIAFFAVAVALVRACEHLIGPDGPATAPASTSAEPLDAAGAR